MSSILQLWDYRQNGLCLMKNSPKILIVDDDELGGEVLEDILSADYQCVAVRSGEEALNAVNTFSPDLILLDIMMPGMDGYEVCRQIRMDVQFSFIKVILVSGNGQVSERLKGYAAGADDYITKPFSGAELKAKVDVFLKLKRLSEVNQIKSDVLSFFSHETRTPLNAVLGGAELLKGDDSLSAEAQQCVELIHDSGKRLLEFAEKAMLLNELKLETVHFRPRKDNLVKHIKAAEDLCEQEKVKKGLSLACTGDLDCDLTVDWPLVDGELYSLIKNAVNYANNESVITVSITAGINDTSNNRIDESENNSIDGSENNGSESCVVRIRDQGEGITESLAKTIFDPFVASDVVHSSQGTGLSLAIAKSVMDLHGGKISTVCRPGDGGEFVLAFP